MKYRDGMNQPLYDAFQAYRRRVGRYEYLSDRQAMIKLMTEAGYTKPALFYAFLNNKSRPSADNRVVLAEILHGNVKKFWPPRPKKQLEVV